MTKKLIWRLKEAPTPESLLELVNNNLLTKDEAREILFTSEEIEERDKKSLESEIKFLRELVDKLSKSKSEIVTIIKEVEIPYKRYPWYNPYITWTAGYPQASTGGSNYLTTSNSSCAFTSIKTF